jgi:UDP-glucose 4-epimerase
MKSLVLGASGYLGGHLLQALSFGGHQAVVPTAADGKRLDLCDPMSLSGVDWNVDAVFMFAGVTGTTASFSKGREFVQGNELALLNVLESIRQTPHRPRVVFPSSRLVYKGADRPLPEEASLEAKTIYAANKIACELLLKAYGNAFHIPSTVLRICVPYGNQLGNGYSHGTIGNFIKQASQHGKIQLYGDGSLRRTFSHVADLCAMTIEAAQTPACENEVFNLPGDDLSLHEAAALIAERAGATIAFREWPELDLRVESGSTVFDASRWLAVTKHMAQHSLARWASSIQLALSSRGTAA